MSSVSLVTSKNAAQLADTDKPFILALNMGENLFEAIMRCAEQVNLKSASISGLGMLTDVTAAYYHLKEKQYQTHLFKGMFELVSLNGNIAWVDGSRFIHIHAALGQEDHTVVGGHIMDATVGPSAEITIVPLAAEIHREYDPNIGLKLMCCPIK